MRASTTSHNRGEREGEKLGQFCLPDYRRTFSLHAAELDTEHSLHVLASSRGLSPPGRLVMYSSDGGAIYSPWAEGEVSLNQYIAERFLAEKNGELGYEMRGHPELPAQSELFVTMHQLPEGLALYAVTQCSGRKPPLVYFENNFLRNDSLSATAELIDIVAGAFSKRARGIVSVAAHNSEPDTFFRRIEHPNIMENPEVPAVRVLRLVMQADDGRQDLALPQRGRIVSRVMPKAVWNQWQRDQWLTAAIEALHPHLAGTSHQPSAAAPHPYTRGKLRFLGELFLICREVDRLTESAAQQVPGAAHDLRCERRRLDRCAAIAAAAPALVEPFTCCDREDTLAAHAVARADTSLFSGYHHAFVLEHLERAQRRRTAKAAV